MCVCKAIEMVLVLWISDGAHARVVVDEEYADKGLKMVMMLMKRRIYDYDGDYLDYSKYDYEMNYDDII